MNDLKNDLKNALATFGVICWFIIVIGGIGATIKGCKNDNNLPRKGNVDIDSITTVNDSIKLEVKHLDSIKNAKVIEVVSLNNDSTVKLFYELVSE